MVMITVITTMMITMMIVDRDDLGWDGGALRGGLTEPEPARGARAFRRAR
jgi:hypothetical protein